MIEPHKYRQGSFTMIKRRMWCEKDQVY
jgi:hypothetical protein